MTQMTRSTTIAPKGRKIGEKSLIKSKSQLQVSQCEEILVPDGLELEDDFEDLTSSSSLSQDPRDSSTPSPTMTFTTLPPRHNRLRSRSKPRNQEKADSFEKQIITLLKHVVDWSFTREDPEDVFGKFVANMLRQITNLAERIKTERKIISILFAAIENDETSPPPNTYPTDPLHPLIGQLQYPSMLNSHLYLNKA